MAFNINQKIVLKLHCDTTIAKKQTNKQINTAHLRTMSHLSLVKIIKVSHLLW